MSKVKLGWKKIGPNKYAYFVGGFKTATEVTFHPVKSEARCRINHRQSLILTDVETVSSLHEMLEEEATKNDSLGEQLLDRLNIAA